MPPRRWKPGPPSPPSVTRQHEPCRPARMVALMAPRDTKHFCAGARATRMAGGGPGGHGSGHLRAHVGAAASRTQLGAGVPVPPRTQGGDLLRGDGVGDGLLQQLQAVQDPVAEPGAAGVQTLRGQEEGSWAGSTPKPAALGHPVGTGTSQGDPQAAPGTAPPLHLPQGHPTARDSGWETPGDNSSSARRPKGSPGAGRRGRAWYLVGFAQLPEASLQVVEVLLPLQHQSARQAGRRSAASSSPRDPLATRARIWAFFFFLS